MILMEMMLEMVIGMLVMEVDKVAEFAEFATNTSYLAAKFLTNESGATW